MTATGIRRPLVRGIRMMAQTQLGHPLLGDKLETMMIEETCKQAEILRQVEHLGL